MASRPILLTIATALLVAQASSSDPETSVGENAIDAVVADGNAAEGGRDVSEETGDLTYYDLGLTACGQTYTNDDMVAALAFDWFTTPNPNNDPMCGRRVRITDPDSSNSVEVEIRDKCEGCQHGDIDVSPAAFQKIKPLEVGRYKVTWDFI